MKRVIFILSLLILAQGSSPLAGDGILDHLKHQENVLLKQWRCQQHDLSEVLLHLKNQATYSPILGILWAKNIATWVHQNLSIQALSPRLKKQQEDSVRLCHDIQQVRQKIKAYRASSNPQLLPDHTLYADKDPA